ncbi:MAG: DUF4783 domain-containing protein [Ginsengibacter sp.]
MKKIFTYCTLIFVLSSFRLSSINEVVNGLKTGNASQVSKYFDNTIDITLSDKSNSYSKSQAELVLKDFFTTNGVVTFELIHSGENAGSQYIIGNLKTKKGIYRTTVYIKQKADRQVLQEIRFEK